MSGGAKLAYNNILTLNETLTKAGDGLLQINNKQAAGGRGVDVQAGTLEGSGNVSGQLAISGGTVNPGKSAGTLSVEGSISQSGGTIHLEIGGLSPGDEYDRLVATGNALLKGTVAVKLIDGFNPARNDSFDVLDFNIMPELPSFNFDLAPLDNGLMWDTSKFTTDGILTVTDGSGGFTDFDNSGFWDLPDLNLVLFNWQQAKANLPGTWINQRPSVVGLDSLNAVLFNWQQASALAVVPEPGTLGLLGAALLGLIGLLVKR